MTTAPHQTSEVPESLRDELKHSIQAYSVACQKIRQHLVKDFGYEVKDANDFINDIVRRAYGFQQEKP